MTGFTIVFSDSFFFRHTHNEDAKQIVSELGKHAYVNDVRFTTRLSSLLPPESVEIVGEIASDSFVKAFFNEAGKSAWKTIASLGKPRETKSLFDLVDVPKRASDLIEEDVVLILTLRLPDQGFDIKLSISHDDPDIPIKTALFIVNANRMKETVRLEIEKGNSPLGYAVVSIQEDYRLCIEWVRSSDMRRIEVSIETTESRRE